MPEGEDDCEFEGDGDDVVEIEGVGECMLLDLICSGGRSEFVGKDEVLEKENYLAGGSIGEPFIVEVF